MKSYIGGKEVKKQKEEKIEIKKEEEKEEEKKEEKKDDDLINYIYINNFDIILNECIKQSKSHNTLKIQISDIFEEEKNKGEGLKILNKYILLGNSLYNDTLIDKELSQENYSYYQSILNKLKSSTYEYDSILNNLLKNSSKDEIIKKLLHEYFKEDRYIILNMLNEELFNKSSKMIKTIYYPTKNSLDLLNIEQLFINNKETANIFYKILKNINSIKQSDYDDKLEILLNSHIIIPITSDIMWYNNSYYIYPLEKDNKMKKESEQKLFYITNIINQTIEEIEKQGYSKNIPNQLKYKNAFYYNDEENNTIIEDNKYSTDPMILNLLQILKDHQTNPYFNITNEYYFNYYTSNTLNSLRQISLLEKNNEYINKNSLVEMRSSSNTSLNIIGYYITSYKNKLISYNDLKEYDYNEFLNQIENKLRDKDVKSGYWLFSEKDKNRLKYINSSENNITLLCKSISEQLFDDVIKININILNDNLDLSKNYLYFLKLIENQFDKLKGINKTTQNKELYTMDDIMLKYKSRWTLQIQDIIYKYLSSYKSSLEDKYNKLYGFEDTITLPTIQIAPENKPILIELEKNIITQQLEDNLNGCICQHYISWDELNKSYNLKSYDYEKKLNNFMVEFVSLNAHKEYICKVCGDKLDITNYVQEGQILNNNTFIATEINISLGKLEDNPNYSQYNGIYGIINGIRSRIITYSKLFNIYEYQDINKKQREGINQLTKDTIDLINYNLLLWKTSYNDYNNEKEEKYNINKNISDFFIFPFNNELYNTKTEFKDIHKTIKQNNASLYICILLINNLSKDQILNLSMNKDCNYDIYEKLFQKFLSSIKIQYDKNNIVNISRYPILCYIIYNFSYNLVHYNRYKLNNNTSQDLTTKEKITLIIKCMITLIDILNSTLLSYIQIDNKDIELNSEIYNYLQKYYLKFKNHLLNIYNDTTLISSLRYNKEKIIDKAQFNQNEITLGYDIDYNKLNYFKYLENLDYFQDLPKYDNIIKNKEDYHYTIQNNDYDFNKYTTCKDGQPHEWNGEDKSTNSIICKNCKLDYNSLKKENYNNIKSNVELYYLKRLSLKYCPTGLYHSFILKNNKRECSLCHYIEGSEMSQKDLKELKKNFYNSQILTSEDIIKDNKTINIISDDKIINEEMKKMISYVKKYYKIIEENDIIINLEKKSYTFNYDYKGNKLDKPLILNEEDIKFTELNNKKVLFYKQKDITIYYDEETLSLIGYKLLNQQFTKYSAYKNCRCEINYSLKDILTYLFIPKYVDNDNNFIYISNEDILNTYYNNICNFLNKINIIITKINNKNSLDKPELKNKKDKTIDDIIKDNNNYLNELVKLYDGKYNKFIIDENWMTTFKYVYLLTLTNIKEYKKQEYTLSLQLFNKMEFNTFYNFSLIYLLKRLNDILLCDGLMTKIIIKLITYEYKNNYQNFNNTNLITFSNIIYASPTYNEYLTYDIEILSEEEISSSEEIYEENAGFDIDNFRDTDEDGNYIDDEEEYDNYAGDSDID